MGIELDFFKRPGGPLEGKPAEDSDGQWHDQFGEKIEDPRKNKPADKDVGYAQKFWKKHQPSGMKEAMIGIIQDSIKQGEKEGLFGIFVNPKGIDDNDRQKISAFRELAKEIGYEIGQFQFNANSGNATARIIKMEK